MGMAAQLLAVGKFKKEIVSFLDYPVGFYEDVKEGSLVCAIIYDCNTTHESEKLAKILKVDPWKFDQHVIKSYVEHDNLDFETKEEFDHLLLVLDILRKNGFFFIFLPNG